MGLRGSLGFMPTGRVAGVASSACAAKCQFQADMLIVGMQCLLPIADIEAKVLKQGYSTGGSASAPRPGSHASFRAEVLICPVTRHS